MTSEPIDFGSLLHRLFVSIVTEGEFTNKPSQIKSGKAKTSRPLSEHVLDCQIEKVLTENARA